MNTVVTVARQRLGTSMGLALALFVCLCIAGAATVDGFTGSLNVRSMLLFASFLGIAAIGQTLCALVGGLDLSIPFVIGAANLLTLWLIGKGVSSGLSVVIVIGLAAVCGALSGLISFRLRGQALIITLGVGFVVQAIAQIITSAGSDQAGTVYGRVPDWLSDASSLQSSVLGVRVAPAVLIWVALSILIIVLLKRTVFGRGVYAIGGNPTAARRALVPEFATWTAVFTLSAVMAAVTGILLLGFSGGAFADVGEPYLFTTVAAVVVGGTALVGGRGGYGLTVMGVAVLTVLTTVLVGLGLELPAQQAVLGLLIVPMVALYGRDSHPRTQI